MGHQETVVQTTTAMIDGAGAQADGVATQACKQNESRLEGSKEGPGASGKRGGPPRKVWQEQMLEKFHWRGMR